MTSRTVTYMIFLLAGAVLGAVARGAIGGVETVTAPASEPAAPGAFQRPPDGDPGAIIDMLESLSVALHQESEYRQSLEDQIIGLEERLDELQARLGAAVPPAGADRNDKLSELRRRGAGPLTVDKLVEAGLDERDAASIKRRVDDLAMQRLYLRDQAMREGWLGDKRYRDESRRIASEQGNLRGEFGDDLYERYLYASGRPNRIQIRNVIENSPAYGAGLQTGDRILSYNGQPTYAPSDLRRASMQGESGEMIALRVDRNGRRIDLYIPRGPLGIQMTGVSEKP